MTHRGRPGHVAPSRALGAVLAGAAAVALVSAAACLADLPAYDADAGPGGQDGGGTTSMTPAPFCGDGIIQRTLPDGGGEVCDPGGDAGSPSTAAGCSADCTTILCPSSGFVGPNDHCYFNLDAGHVPMAAAVSGCSAQGAHVVTLSGQPEEDNVDSHLVDASGGAYWLALTEDMPPSAKAPIYDVGSINEPGWRSTCAGCYGPTLGANATSFNNICKLTVGQCVAKPAATEAFTGETCDGECDDAGLVHAVCEREPVGLSGQPCDDGGVCISLASFPSTYEFVPSLLTRSAAATNCEAKKGPNGQSGHLVIFQSRQEREQLSRELSALTQPALPQLSYWVGLQNTSATSGASWTWDDGTPVVGGNYDLEWADNEPTPGFTLAYGLVATSSAASSFDRQLIKTDNDSEAPRYFVCEFDGTN